MKKTGLVLSGLAEGILLEVPKKRSLSCPLWWVGGSRKMAGFKEREEMYTLIVRFVCLIHLVLFTHAVVKAHKRNGVVNVSISDHQQWPLATPCHAVI